MKKGIQVKRLFALMLALAVAFTSANVMPTEVLAASNRAVKKVAVKVGKKTVTKKTIVVQKGKSKKLKVTVTPSSAKKKVAYKSSKKSVATVSSKGKIKAKKAGTAKITITVTGKNGKKKTTYVKVKVVNKVVAPTSISATANKTNLTVGETSQVSVNISPSNATDKSVTYSSNNTKVVTVDSNGKVKAVAAGSAVVTAKTSNGKTATVNFTVSATGVAVTGVTATLSPADTINVGETTNIVASVQPANATDKQLTYSSSDASVATVNAVGAITGLKAGTAVIRATAKNGKYAEVAVTVTAVKVTGVSLDKTETQLTVTGTTNLKVTVAPENASNKKLVWSSSDEKIARVNQDGTVSAVAVGTATITVKTEDGAFTATCKVTVKSENVNAEGISLEVTNVYEDNSGTKYPNTVLLNRDMYVRARVITNGQPLGNQPVSLKMKKLYGNCSNRFEIKEETVRTDADGYANFTIGLKNEYFSETTVTDYLFQSFTITASAGSETASTTVKFASVVFDGITVDNNLYLEYNDIVPSDEAAAGDNGIYTTRSTNYIREQEYVSSQQTSSDEDDHQVYFSATPWLLMPATSETAHSGKWLYEMPAGEGISGPCSVYNDQSNLTTTTIVKEIPAGLQYITLFFDKIALSRYTAMYVDVYDTATGTVAHHKEVTEIGNSDSTSAVQMTTQEDRESYLVVSLISQGQVDVSNQGYVLTKIEGPWRSTNDELTTAYELPASVKWEDVSKNVTYEITEWTYAKAKEYIPAGSEYLNPDYSYAYKVPHFPYSGDAYITVKDKNGKLKATFLYPTLNDLDEYNKNVNILAPKDGNHQAMFVAAEQLAPAEGITFKTNENQAIVDSRNPGLTALKATITVNGLNETELGILTGKELYTSVQWTNVPNKEVVTEIPDFYAIEGQSVKVLAQLYDKNSHAKSAQGEKIEFKDEFEKIIAAQGDVIGGGVKEVDGDDVTVSAISNSGVTDEKGQVLLTLTGDNIDYVEGLVATSKNYNVRLKVANEPEVEAADIYWVDLGSTFVDSAVESDAPVRTTNFDSKLIDIVKQSKTVVGKTWDVGYLTVARSHKFNYTNPASVDRFEMFNEFVDIKNIPLKYDKNGVGNCKAANNVATISSDKIGDTKLSGYIDAVKLGENAVSAAVEFVFYDSEGKEVTYKNVGTGTTSLGETGLTLTMIWELKGMGVNVITPNGTNIDKNTDTVVYVEVLDELQNAYENQDVQYTITGANAATATGKTDKNGIFALNLSAPGEAGMCNITFKVGNDIEKPVSLNYIETAQNQFGIMDDDTENQKYALEYLGKNQMKLYFTNRINVNTLIAKQFKFVQDGSTDVQYLVTAVEGTDDNNAIIITLDRDIVNVTADHTVTIEGYTDTRNIVYEFVDAYGQKLTGNTTYNFKPSERQ